MQGTLSRAAIAILGGVAIATTAMPALAQYPEKPLTILEPWAPGSAGDVPMRILAELASEDFGQPIVVQNLEGGTGTRAQLAVKNADPDGYTIMNAWVAPQVMAPIFNPDVGYTRNDFEPIILVNINPFVLVVPGDHPANTTEEFVEWAKAQPGNVNVGVCGWVGLPHLVFRRFLEVAEIENYNPVPFSDCEIENMKALLDGTTQYAVGGLSVRNIYGDQVKLLTIFMPERSNIAPDIPTAAEGGYDLGWGPVAAGWSGLVAPEGTSPERLAHLREVFAKAVASPEFEKRMTETGNTMLYLPTDEFEALWDQSHELLKPALEILQQEKQG
ncbi:MAG: tripartite tricarboxylate transporter substrate binding protein [Pseudomonadota bacterium]